MTHKQSKTLVVWLVFSMLLAALPYISFAQEKTEEGFDVIYLTEEESNAMRAAAVEGSMIPEGLDSCFEHYDFGSVAVVPESELTSTVPGATIGIPVTIQNKNTHPIVDGMVYVKVFKVRDSENIQFGDDVVDQFVALKNITLPASGKKYDAFEWKVPSNAEAGTYRIATYFISAQRFNLEGLSFTDDIIGGSVELSVRSDVEGTVRFDREGVTVNGETHEFATFMPVYDEKTSDVSVVATITNTTDKSYQGVVSWTLYGWDGLQSRKILEKKTEPVQIGAGITGKVSYKAGSIDKSIPVYYLVGELTYGESKSIIDVRYVHVSQDTAWARFNDVGISGYPLQEGALAYACFQGFSGSSGEFPDGRVEIEVRAPGFFGTKVIGKRVYEGVMPQDFAALPVPITAGAENLIVSAALYVEGRLVDTVDMQYSCETLMPGLCTEEGNGGTLYAIIVTILAILLGGAVLVLYRHIGGGPTGNPNAITSNSQGITT